MKLINVSRKVKLIEGLVYWFVFGLLHLNSLLLLKVEPSCVLLRQWELRIGADGIAVTDICSWTRTLMSVQLTQPLPNKIRLTHCRPRKIAGCH